MEKLPSTPVRNRYAAARRKADWTIDQDWTSYSHEEHDRWDRLFARQAKLLPGRACDAFLEAQAKLELSRGGVPDFADLSRRLSALTGWSVVAVAGLIPDDAFFEHLANRRFPAGAFIRPTRAFFKPTARVDAVRSASDSCTISRGFIGTRWSSD